MNGLKDFLKNKEVSKRKRNGLKKRKSSKIPVLKGLVALIKIIRVILEIIG